MRNQFSRVGLVVACCGVFCFTVGNGQTTIGQNTKRSADVVTPYLPAPSNLPTDLSSHSPQPSNAPSSTQSSSARTTPQQPPAKSNSSRSSTRSSRQFASPVSLPKSFLSRPLPPSMVPPPRRSQPSQQPSPKRRRSMPKLPRVRTASRSPRLPSIMGTVPAPDGAPLRDTAAIAQVQWQRSATSRKAAGRSARSQQSDNAIQPTSRTRTRTLRTAQRHDKRGTENRVRGATYSRVDQFDSTGGTGTGCSAGCVRTLGASGARGCTACDAQPLGSSLHAYLQSHIQQGRRAQLVLYRYDFGPGPKSVQLNEAGRRKLGRLSRLMQSTTAPLVIEAVAGQPELGAARQEHVAQALARHDQFGATAGRIIVRPVSRFGLRGAEAQAINQNEIQTLESRGTTIESSEGFTGATTSGQ